MSNERRQKQRISYSVILFISNSRISKLTYGTTMKLGGRVGQGRGIGIVPGNLIRRVIISPYTLAKIHQPVCLKSVCPFVCKLQLNKKDFKPSPAQSCPWPHPAPARLSPAQLSMPLIASIALWLLLCLHAGPRLPEGRRAAVLRPHLSWAAGTVPGTEHMLSKYLLGAGVKKEQGRGGSGPEYHWCRRQKGPRGHGQCHPHFWHEKMEAKESKSSSQGQN